MPADDPIIIARKNQQETDSLDALRRALRPWRATLVDGRDDIGRDGFVQVNDPLVGRPGDARATPIMFGIQVRSHAASFDDIHREKLDTRHLQLWSANSASCFILFVWSKGSNAIRWRSARDLRAEADGLHPNWKTQASVTLDLRREHMLVDLEQLRRRVEDESDREGGVVAFHSAVRRVVLTEVIADGAATGHTVTFSWEKKGKPDGIIYLGPWWNGEDLDPSETDGLAVLASACLLYEETWIPLSLVPATLRLLGRNRFRSLVEAERLRFWDAGRVGFVHSTDLRADRWGALVTMSTGRSPVEELTQWTQQIANEQHAPELGEVMLKAVRPLTSVTDRAQAILDESTEDLRKPVFRRMLGISEHVERIPVWDAVLANRILHLNTAMAVAEELRADVVEYEGGLSRLASEKFYSRLRLDRLYPTAKALDAVLRSGGMPDVGGLVRTVGAEKFFAEIASTAAQDFRDWFWSSASALVGSGADMRSQIEHAAAQIFPINDRSLSALRQLRLRFFQNDDGRTHVGAPLASHPIGGFAARVSNADALLRLQARNHFARRTKKITQFLGRAPDKYEPCPCLSGQKYKFCCGNSAV